MTDPYKVLGLASTATDDEVKAAYRKLAKKYHPDANPGDKYAEMKMKEINAAYDSIVNGTWARSQSGQGNPYGSYGDPFGGYGNPYGRQGDPFGGYGDPFGGSYGYGRRESRSEEDPHLQAALNYMNYGRWHEAVNVLNNIQNRDAKWYYYSALAQEGLGNRIEAVKFATRATEMDPYNEEYHRCLERLQNPNAYSGYRRVVTFPSKGSSSICGGFVISWLMCMYCNFCCR